MNTTPKPEPTPTLAPTACPFCQSSKITTPSEKVDANTYWRCDACGQMWNVARQRATHRNQFGLGLAAGIIGLVSAWQRGDQRKDMGAVSSQWIAEHRMGSGDDSRR